MKIHLIVGHLKESYEGQYAPDVLDAINEYGNDENPFEWLEPKLEEYRKDKMYNTVQIITIEVPSGEIMKRLYPSSDPIKSTAMSTTPTLKG